MTAYGNQFRVFRVFRGCSISTRRSFLVTVFRGSYLLREQDDFEQEATKETEVPHGWVSCWNNYEVPLFSPFASVEIKTVLSRLSRSLLRHSLLAARCSFLVTPTDRSCR